MVQPTRIPNFFKHSLFAILLIGFQFHTFSVFASPFLSSCRKSFAEPELIGQGDNSYIYRISEKRVLRTFKSSDPIRAAANFARGYDELVEGGVKNLAHVRARGPGFVIQDYVPIHFDFYYFIFKADEMISKDPLLFEKIKNSLMDFARSTANFDDIGDFHPGQLGWTGHSWYLLDWNSLHAPTSALFNDHTFQGIERPTALTKDLYLELEREILAVRSAKLTDKLRHVQ